MAFPQMEMIIYVKNYQITIIIEKSIYLHYKI